MKHLLINGCSYATGWENYNQLADKLLVDNVSNIGRSGASNDRIFRTTTEYILDNPTVDFVIVMLTFFTRFEAPWAVDKGDQEGPWVSYSPQGINFIKDRQIENHNKQLILEKYVKDKFIYDYNANYIDKTLINLIWVTAWLEMQNINYCIFNSCENQWVSVKRMDQVRKNKKIINLSEFMSNQWMYDNGAKIQPNELDKNIEPRWAHYGKDGYTLLNNFLYNYIKEHCL